MGIQNVNSLLKDICSDAFRTIELDYFRKHRIAVDMFNWCYTQMSTILKSYVNAMKDPLEDIDRGVLVDRLIRKLVEFIVMLTEHDISPVFVREGEAPVEKLETKDERLNGRIKLSDEIKELKKKISEMHPLERTQEDYALLRIKLCRFNVISKNELEMMANIIDGLGIPVLQGPGESESYCAALAINRLVIAVWSNDTDNYALGTPLMITGNDFSYNTSGVRYVNMVTIPYLLHHLGFNQDELRDFCIMCGCDFNVNINNIGVKRAYKYISTYRSIDRFHASTGKDISVLRHVRCRELLTPPPVNITHEDPRLNVSLDKFLANGSYIVSQYPSITSAYNKLVVSLRNLSPPCKVVLSGDEKEKSPTAADESKTQYPENVNHRMKVKVLKDKPVIVLRKPYNATVSETSKLRSQLSSQISALS